MKNGYRLKELIDELGMTQKVFAGAVGISESTLSGYIHTEREPDMSTLARIAKKLNVTADFLLDLQDNPSGAFHISDSERLFLTKYRSLSQSQKELVLDMVALIITHSEKQKKYGRRAGDRPPSEIVEF